MKTKLLCIVFYHFNLDSDIATAIGDIKLDYTNTKDTRFYNKLRKKLEEYAFDVIEWGCSIEYHVDVTKYD